MLKNRKESEFYVIQHAQDGTKSSPKTSPEMASKKTSKSSQLLSFWQKIFPEKKKDSIAESICQTISPNAFPFFRQPPILPKFHLRKLYNALRGIKDLIWSTTACTNLTRYRLQKHDKTTARNNSLMLKKFCKFVMFPYSKSPPNSKPSTSFSLPWINVHGRYIP